MKTQSQAKKPDFRDSLDAGLVSLEKAVAAGKLSRQRASRLVRYWNWRVTDNQDPLYNNFYDLHLFQALVQGNCLLAFLVHPRDLKVLTWFGIEAWLMTELTGDIREKVMEIPRSHEGVWLEKSVPDEKQPWQVWVRRLSMVRNYQVSLTRPDNHSEFLLFQVYYDRSGRQESIANISGLYENYYLIRSFGAEQNFADLTSFIDEELRRLIRANRQARGDIVITIFQFQPFREFFRVAGEHFAREVMAEIKQMITGLLKSEDLFFAVSPRVYMVVSPDCTEEVMRQRFKGIFFQIKSIILEYKTVFLKANQPEDLEEIWPRLLT